MADTETTTTDPAGGAPTAGQEGAQAGPRAQMVANPFPVEEIYCDGVSGLFARGGVVKLDLFRALGVDPKSQTERRQVTCRLVLPVTAVPDVMRAFQTMVRAAQQAAAKSEAEASGDAEISGDSGAGAGDITLP